jgi:hypothetical protein
MLRLYDSAALIAILPKDACSCERIRLAADISAAANSSRLGNFHLFWPQLVDRRDALNLSCTQNGPCELQLKEFPDGILTNKIVLSVKLAYHIEQKISIVVKHFKIWTCLMMILGLFSAGILKVS